MMSLFQTFGQVAPPPHLSRLGGNVASGGLVNLLNIVFNMLVVLAGLYVLLQLILAGFGWISAGGDSKSVEAAWGKIWQSLVGLLVVAGSFALAAVVGYLFFGDPSAILKPKIFTP